MSNERLEPGSQVPYFKTHDVSGRLVDIAEYKDKRVLLTFYRFVTCPICNFRVSQFMRLYPEIKDDVVVIAVFESSKEYIDEYIGPKGIPFPVIADPDGVLYKHYGVEVSWFKAMLSMLKPLTMMKAMFNNKFRMGPITGRANRVPADFLIDKGGVLHKCYYGSDISDHIPLRQITEFTQPSRQAQVFG